MPDDYRDLIQRLRELGQDGSIAREAATAIEDLTAKLRQHHGSLGLSTEKVT